MSSGPLAGIRILEVCHVLAGPYAGMLLADLGAEVIKIEPANGDMARGIGPYHIGPHNGYFASLNRNKKSVVLDLGDPEGQAALHELAGDAHALITNMRPATIRSFGLTYETLKEHNPRLVCVALTGFGLDGPWADKPAYDYVVQAATGIMALTGDPGAPPLRPGYSAADNSTGIMGALGLLAKLVEGKGGQVDVSLYDTMLSQLNYLAEAWLTHGERPQRTRASAHPYLVPAQVFATRDGFMVLFIAHDGFWRRFCELVERPEWADDPRFATARARDDNRETVVAMVAELLQNETTAHWVEFLGGAGLVVSGVESLEDALAGEQAAAREMVISVGTPDGPIRMAGNPIKITGAVQQLCPPPLLGEHSSEILGKKKV